MSLFSYRRLKRHGLIFICLCLLSFQLFMPSLIMAQNEDFYKSLQTPFYDPNSGTSAECLSGPAGSGPLYGPFFPKVKDVNEVTKRLTDYVKKTRPDSPLIAFTPQFVSEGLKNNVNPAMVLAMTQKETSLATAGHGQPPKYNIANIRGEMGDGTGFRSYSGYPEGIQKTTEHLAGDLYLGGGFTTVREVINRWAPPIENDTSDYVRFVNQLIPKLLSGLGEEGSETPVDSGLSSTSCGGSSGEVSVDGYAFPVAPQRKTKNGRVPGMSALPCNSNNCHHDGSVAFDISAQPGGDSIAGTPVYAISDGKIDMAHTYSVKGREIPGCYSLQLHSSKDNYWYWYGHIQNLRVKTGDIVKAGEQVGEIGIRKCTGNGSDSHLHIDRGCVKNGVPQKGGSVECRDPAFKDLINKLWEALPA